MSAIAVRTSWPGFPGIKHIVIFGASYCDVGYNAKAPHPSPEHPLGVEFPGMTWCGTVDQLKNKFTPQPNWVGHLVEIVKEQRGASSLLVYDYALGGDTVQGVKRQIHHDFLPHLAPKPDWAPWSPDDTLFITWVGINDCGYNGRAIESAHKTKDSVEELFKLQEELYQAGARNFCWGDVPPTYDYPGVSNLPHLREAVTTWNESLRHSAQNFCEEHEDTTAFLWSSWKLFSQVLADPLAFGFAKEEATKKEGDIFLDGLHPTSKVHRLIAQDMLSFLEGVASPTEGKNCA
ncbi:hypothetical protein GY45DRAFT_1436490 [Cubamyces sp. BRFM 1775]|nr:hypothetical protein GY45DRAFT_1436490 [Cubamyces sp. BRFM 1775]